MAKLTDETLMYYADGLLSPSEKEWVEKLLDDDPDLRSRLRIFQATGRSLAGLLEAADGEPVPPAMSHFVSTLKAGRSGERRWRPVGLSFGSACMLGVALAAGIGLGLLFGAGGVGETIAMGDFIRIDRNRLLASEPLQRALDITPGGKVAALPQSGGPEFQLKVKSTFQNKRGNYCRQYELAAEARGGYAGSRYVGVACRVEDRWEIEFQSPVAPVAGKGQITPAAGETRPMDAAVGALMEGGPLRAEDEAAILGAGWTKQ